MVMGVAKFDRVNVKFRVCFLIYGVYPGFVTYPLSERSGPRMNIIATNIDESIIHSSVVIVVVRLRLEFDIYYWNFIHCNAPLICWSRDKMEIFADGILKSILLSENVRLSIQISLKVVPVGPGNGMAPNRRHAITPNNADPVHWRIYASLVGDELTSSSSISRPLTMQRRYVNSRSLIEWGCFMLMLFHIIHVL